jgi:biopolymer transport protein TolR
MGAKHLSLSKNQKRQPEPEMNVTPLVDVVLVLLIIFMVITPALNDGEHVEVPEMTKPDPKPKDADPIDVVLAKNGRVLVENQAIEPSALRGVVAGLHEKSPDRVLLLKADARLNYGRVREAFADLQDLGFKGVSLKVSERKTAETATK